MGWEPGQSGNKAAQWKPGKSGNPSGKSAQIEAARATVRDFMINGGGLTAWMSLVLDKDPKVRMYVFRRRFTRAAARMWKRRPAYLEWHRTT